MECEKDSSGFSRFWRPRALTLQRRVPCVLMSWLTVELLLTVTRGGEDRHVLSYGDVLHLQTVGHLTEEGDAHHLAHLATSLPRWLAQRIKERIRLVGRAQPGRRVAQPHAHVGLTEHIGDDR